MLAVSHECSVSVGVASAPGNPADVGAAIVAAVSDPTSPLQVTVGADAELFLDAWKNTGTFESFSAAMG